MSKNFLSKKLIVKFYDQLNEFIPFQILVFKPRREVWANSIKN